MKECYYYLDSTPTHSYMKALYKYPQNEYPYSWLVDENRRRSRQEPEFELCDTGEKMLFIVQEKMPKNWPQVRILLTLHWPPPPSLWRFWFSIKLFFFPYMYGLRDSVSADFPINILWKIFEILLEAQLQCTSILHQGCHLNVKLLGICFTGQNEIRVNF